MAGKILRNAIGAQLKQTLGPSGSEAVIAILGNTLDGTENVLNTHLRAEIRKAGTGYDEDQIEDFQEALARRMAEKFVPLIRDSISQADRSGSSLIDAARALNATLSGLSDENLKKIGEANISEVLATAVRARGRRNPPASTASAPAVPRPVTIPQQTMPQPSRPRRQVSQTPSWSSSSSSVSSGGGESPGGWSSRSGRSGGKGGSGGK